jgi:hypothetical protein
VTELVFLNIITNVSYTSENYIVVTVVLDGTLKSAYKENICFTESLYEIIKPKTLRRSSIIATRHILTLEFVQINNNIRRGFRSDKNVTVVFVNVTKQKNGFGAFRKETGRCPASSLPTSSTVYGRTFGNTSAVFETA